MSFVDGCLNNFMTFLGKIGIRIKCNFEFLFLIAMGPTV